MLRHRVARDIDHCIDLFMRDGGEVLEEVRDPIPRLQVVPERLDRHARPGEAGCAREDVGIDEDDGSSGSHVEFSGCVTTSRRATEPHDQHPARDADALPMQP